MFSPSVDTQITTHTVSGDKMWFHVPQHMPEIPPAAALKGLLMSMHGSCSTRLTCSCTGAPRAVSLGIARGQPVGGEVDIAICLCSSEEVVSSDQLLVAQGGGEVTGGVAPARPGGGGGGGGKVGLQGSERRVGVEVG